MKSPSTTNSEFWGLLDIIGCKTHAFDPVRFLHAWNGLQMLLLPPGWHLTAANFCNPILSSLCWSHRTLAHVSWLLPYERHGPRMTFHRSSANSTAAAVPTAAPNTQRSSHVTRESNFCSRVRHTPSAELERLFP